MTKKRSSTFFRKKSAPCRQNPGSTYAVVYILTARENIEAAGVDGQTGDGIEMSHHCVYYLPWTQCKRNINEWENENENTAGNTTNTVLI